MGNKERTPQQELSLQKENSCQTHGSCPLRVTRCPHPSRGTVNITMRATTHLECTTPASQRWIPAKLTEKRQLLNSIEITHPTTEPFFYFEQRQTLKIMSKLWNKQTSGYREENSISQCCLCNFRKKPLNISCSDIQDQRTLNRYVAHLLVLCHLHHHRCPIRKTVHNSVRLVMNQEGKNCTIHP